MSVEGGLKQSKVFRRQRKGEKVMVGPGSREYKAGYKTHNYRELRARWRGLVGRLEVGHERASRGVLQTEHGLRKREKERESGGWTRAKGV